MVLLTALTVASCCGDKDLLPHKNAPANLLFIVIDTLRADQIALHGGPTATPNMEALAKRGVLFEQAYSHAPITGPSHASMFTSLLPSRHGVHNNADVLRPNYVTLAEILKGRSCATTAFISLEALKSKYKVLQGFDAIHEEFPNYWWKTAGELNEEMLPWLDDNSSRPFFLLAHYSDPHGPYVPPSWYQTIPPHRARSSPRRKHGSVHVKGRSQGTPVPLEVPQGPLAEIQRRMGTHGKETW